MKKILIVDDHADIRRLIRMTLEFEAYNVFEAEDGEGALAVAMQEQPDLVLLDVMMPGSVNGLQVCGTLKSLPKPPRILLLTARGRSEDLEAGLQAGADAYMVKPFSPLKLMETIDQQWEV